MKKKGIYLMAISVLIGTMHLSAQNIKVYNKLSSEGISATASSELPKSAASDAINGEGMTASGHIANPQGLKMWTSGISTAKIRANKFTKEGVVWFMCKLGDGTKPADVDLIRIWNYNQSEHTRRGLRKVYIEYSSDGKAWNLLKNGESDYHIIEESKGRNPEPADFTLKTKRLKIKYLCITADCEEGNYYDRNNKIVLREAADMGQNINYYGLSEVAFYKLESVPVNKSGHVSDVIFKASQGYRKSKNGPSREYSLSFNSPLYAGGELQFEAKGMKWSERIDVSPLGITNYEGLFPPGYMQEETKINIRLTSSQGSFSKEFAVPGARRWRVYFLPHSHQDIGYTHIQGDVMKLQWRNFERALELAERSSSYPEGSRFKWNSEATWALAGYLDHYKGTEKYDRMVRAIKNGTLGVDAALGSILTGICKQEELMHLFDDAHKISKITGVEFNTAMMSDVPGQVWGLVTAMAQNGVKYYSPGPNYVPFYGKVGNDRAAHLHVYWGDKPFYWQSRSGSDKVLFWQSGRGYSFFHGWLANRLSACGTDPVWEYLSDLEAREYPYNTCYLRYTVHGDNGPPDEQMPDVIKAWNEKYDSPKFIIGTTKELFTEFEKEYGEKLPVYGGDMTPTWEDGAASTARELALNRESSERLNQAEILWSMLNQDKFPSDSFTEAWKNVILFSEHTWGASASGPDPESEFTKKLWTGKKLFADSADVQSQRLMATALSPARSDNGDYVHVINTNLWSRSDVVQIDTKTDLTGKELISPAGEICPLQKTNDGRWIFIARDVKPLSESVFRIADKKNLPEKSKSMVRDGVLDNNLIRLEIDKVRGTISTLTRYGENYNYASENGLNDFIYTGRYGSNPGQIEKIISISVVDDGEVAATLRVLSEAPGCRSLTRDITLYRGMERVDIVNCIDKKNVYKEENIRFIFPFNIEHGEVAMDMAMSEMYPERDQLRGVNKNYYSVQNGLSVSNMTHGIYLTTIDAPFIEMGEMSADLWRKEGKGLGWASSAQISPKIFSWVMNNSWRTNYKASQEGKATFRYSLEIFDPFDNQLKRYCTEQAERMVAVVSGKPGGIESLFRLRGKNQVALSVIKPSEDNKGYIVRLFNMNDQSVHTSFDWGSIKPRSIYRCDHNQQNTGPFDDTSFWLKPFECITLKIEAERN
jgi:hypothetical protein